MLFLKKKKKKRTKDYKMFSISILGTIEELFKYRNHSVIDKFYNIYI